MVWFDWQRLFYALLLAVVASGWLELHISVTVTSPHDLKCGVTFYVILCNKNFSKLQMKKIHLKSTEVI